MTKSEMEAKLGNLLEMLESLSRRTDEVAEECYRLEVEFESMDENSDGDADAAIDLKHLPWSDLKNLVGSGQFFRVGDWKEADFGPFGKIRMQVAKAASGKVDFVAMDLLKYPARMNPWYRVDDEGNPIPGTGTIGEWDACELKRYLNEVVLSFADEDIRESISDCGLGKLWIPSHEEVFGPDRFGIYTDYESRQLAMIGTTFASNWWLRSANSTTYWYGVNGNGNYIGNTSTYTRGVALGFSLASDHQ